MEESLNRAKEAIQQSLEALREIPSKPDRIGDLRDMQMRVQMARNVLVQNEKKIWLRTKEGREMLTQIGEAASRFLEEAKKAQGSGPLDEESWRNLLTALGEVELKTKSMGEESRRRSMVVT